MPNHASSSSQKLTRLNMESEVVAPITVLLIEDSRTVRAQLREFIGLLDHVDLVEAGTLAEAQTILQRRTTEFFCAIVDLTLPDARGLESVLAVRAHGVPIIVLTGTVDPVIRQMVLAQQVIDYIVKNGISAIEDTAYLVGRLRQNQSMKVIVADDSRTFRTYVGELLARYHFTVHEATDGAVALDLLTAHPDTALLLTDYHMPNLNGLELIRQVRQQHRREDLAIIALSQSGHPDLSAAMLKAGANDYMPKNFLVEEFYCRLVQNANMVHYVRTLQDMANRDYLTRLHNRRHLYQAAERLYAETKRQGDMLAVAMVDADRFKRINDQHGHAAGDEALKCIARVLRRTCLRGDLVARYGGEEFVCAMRVAHREDAWQRFENLRQAIETIELKWEGTPIPITVSIGLTTDFRESFVAMLDLADQAVFHAKAEGRNRIVALPESSAQPVGQDAARSMPA